MRTTVTQGELVKKRHLSTALVASACLVGSIQATTAQVGASAATPGGAARAVVSPDVDLDATLRFATVPTPSSWDPHNVANVSFAFLYMSPVYDRLFALDEQNQPVPMLATGSSLSDDGLTLTLTLRDDVVFHDGSALDADAVVATMERALDPSSSVAGFLRGVTAVEATGPNEVAFSLEAPNPTIVHALATAAGMIISPAAVAEGRDLSTGPAGSGAFVLVSQDATTAAYERNESYWDPDAALVARKEISGIGESQARLNALRTGQADIIAITSGELDQARSMVETGEFELHVYPGPIAYTLYLNTSTPPFDNPAVRTAMNMAVNRELLRDGVLGGVGDPFVQVFPEGMAGHVAGAGFELDPDAARQIIADEGAEGAEFTALVNDSPVYLRLAEVVQQDLAAIGLVMHIEPINAQQARPAFRDGSQPALLLVSQVTTVDPSAVMQAYVGIDNPGGADEELARLAAEARSLPVGSDERQAAYEDVTRYVLEHPVHVHLNAFPSIFLSRVGVVGADTMPYAALAPTPDTAGLGLAAS